MQERKRLEQSVADEQRIATMASDLDTLFELAREGDACICDGPSSSALTP